MEAIGLLLVVVVAFFAGPAMIARGMLVPAGEPTDGSSSPRWRLIVVGLLVTFVVWGGLAWFWYGLSHVRWVQIM